MVPFITKHIVRGLEARTSRELQENTSMEEREWAGGKGGPQI